MKKSPTVKTNGNLAERFAAAMREAKEKNITLIRYSPATEEAWRITPDGKVEPHDLGPSQTDWAAIAAMTDEEIEAAAASDPDAQPLTRARYARMKAARQRLMEAKKRKTA